ncbi:hypothetical protein [Actinoplanes sp. NPDC026670]|uniref:hypothetical protein n=1 Tax=Actinoplanes sp. NPDC026670 TaxID=3154700 RepID=UPI0033FE582E
MLALAATTPSLADAAGALAIAVPQLPAADTAPVSLAVAYRMAVRYGVWTGDFPADTTRLVLDVYLLRNRRHGLRLPAHARKTLQAILAAALPEVRASLNHLAASPDTSYAIEPPSLMRKLQASDAALQ